MNDLNKKCSKCGAKNLESSKYCNECGQHLKEKRKRNFAEIFFALSFIVLLGNFSKYTLGFDLIESPDALSVNTSNLLFILLYITSGIIFLIRSFRETQPDLVISSSFFGKKKKFIRNLAIAILSFCALILTTIYK